jgi:two-component system, NtrC family, sensor kinase
MTAVGQKKTPRPVGRLGLYRARLPFSLSLKILFAFTFIVVAGFFVTIRLSLGLIYDNIWRETQDKLSTDLKIARMMYDRAGKDAESVVDFTANRFFLVEAIEAGDVEHLQSLLERIRNERGLDIFVLVDNQGKVVLRTTPPFNKGDDVSNDQLVRLALAGQKAAGTVVLDPARLRLEGEDLAFRSQVVVKPTQHALASKVDLVEQGMMMMAAYPIYNVKGEKLGALYGGKLLNNDTGLVDGIRTGIFPSTVDQVNSAMATIFFRDVRIATSLTLPTGNRATGHRAYADVSETVLLNGRNWLGTAWVVQDWYFAVYEPIRDPDGKVIGALGIGLWKAPFIAVRDNFIWRYIKISLLGLGVILVLGALFSRMLTKPMRDLVEAAEELARGNLNFRVAIKPDRDEIRDLEIAFNAMAQSLMASMQEKDQLAGELHDLNQRYMELLGFASHELKQPVGVIKLTVHNLRKMGPFITPDKFDGILDRLDRNIDYITSMSEKYLQYSKIESGELQVYPQETEVLAAVIAPALEGEQKNISEKGIKVEVLEEAELAQLKLLVDPEMMRVVFSNLISNAVKYGYQGGYIQIGFSETDASYLFNVKNNGEGIPAESIGGIFQKFKRLDNVRIKQKGTGLGLFNARKIVELHGGRIWAESEPGKWADFIFELPKERVNISSQARKDGDEKEIWGY